MENLKAYTYAAALSLIGTLLAVAPLAYAVAHNRGIL